MSENRSVEIEGHLVLPFGTATKADITRIHLVRVAANGIRLESDVPVVHIDKSKKQPLTLAHFERAFAVPSADLDGQRLNSDEKYGLWLIANEIKKHNPNMTKHEELFVDLFFQAAHDHHFKEWLGEDKQPGSTYSALLPIPEMQIYVADPLDDSFGWEPNNNFRVDYGFWNGSQLMAVEIDGSEPSGYARDVRRDRLLRRAGVDVIHILNVELEKHGLRAVRRLLPGYVWGSRKVKLEPFIPF